MNNRYRMAVVLVIALGAWGCQSKTPSGASNSSQRASTDASSAAPTSQPAPPASPVAIHEPRVLIEAGAGLLRIPVELATTPEQRRQGLMYRRHLKKGTGMLFVFDEQRVHSFWMKNTYIPLDMIFIDEGMTVAGIVHRATPETENARVVKRPSRYVLEVNGGFAKTHGITQGDRVSFEGPGVPR